MRRHKILHLGQQIHYHCRFTAWCNKILQ